MKVNDNVKKALDTLGIKLVKADEGGAAASAAGAPAKTEDAPETNDLIKADVDALKGSMEALKTVVAEIFNKEEGETITKAVITEAISGISTEIGKKLEAVGNIEKALYDMVSSLSAVADDIVKGIEGTKRVSDDLRNSVEAIAVDVKKIGDQGMPQRSYTSKAYIEKAFDGELKGNEKVMSATTDREAILELMEGMAGNIEKGMDGLEDKGMYQAMLTFEASGNIGAETLKKIKDVKRVVIIP